MSISSFIQAKSKGAPLLALPVFLKRGLVQRSLFCSSDSLLVSPDQLSGRRIGLVGYTSSMAVWMRGVLDEECWLSRSSPSWFILTASPQKTQLETRLLQIPKDFVAAEIQAGEELDGYSHHLDRRERFLVYLLQRGDLDAIVSFQARIASKDIRPLLANEDEFWSHYVKKGVYPINHLFVMQEDIFAKFPKIGEILLSAFKEARKLWVDYLPDDKRGAMEKEIERLGWDPFACHFGDVEKRTLETFIGYLLKEKMISERPSVDQLFYRDVIEEKP
ncbi:MAG: hypothetical protein HY695_07400 [Deltaproteobacteria bacterium]|nr:hypothetical protein [Deltaproteobacteria bacterium]